MDRIRGAIYQLLEQDHPMTNRQAFYRLVSTGVVEKTEAEYKGTVCRLLAEMRLSGAIPFSWIADNTRWMRKPRTYHGLRDMLERSAATYRRALWDNQDVYVEIWLEKDALAGVLVEVTQNWDVPLMVTRGYASLSYLYSAAETIKAAGKPAYLYYLGDHDPSGVDIDRAVEQRLRQFAPMAEIHFQRIAVLPEQIDLLSLPTRPTKTSDSRSKGFIGGSVEVDAIPPATLRALVNESIKQHCNPEALYHLEQIEDSERSTLNELLERWTA
jgi:hypothetical protein